MSVPSFQFLALVAIVALLLVPLKRWRRGVLVLVNVAFFCTFVQGKTPLEWAISLVPFALFVAAGYAAMRLVERVKNRWVFYVVLGLLIAAFCWIKRYAFVPHAAFLTEVYTTVGLSYAFFRVVGLIVDAYQNVLPARAGVLSYVNYVLNFTSFVSGPVELYKPFYKDEVAAPAPIDLPIAVKAVERIVLGFFKVTILSPLLSLAQDRALDLIPSQLTATGKMTDAAVIVAIFPIYLYVNFSGYTDVVIGAARFLRFELPENFNAPFLSRGYLEFWTRWHMSLANWFKTYVYSPFLLALMRRFTSREIEPMLGVIAYFFTFFLVGLWHGQSAMFVVLGLLMGLGTSGNKLFQTIMVAKLGRQGYRTLCDRPAYASLSAGLTFLWLAATLVCFWATADQAAHLYRLLGVGPIVAALAIIWFAAAALYWLWTRAIAPLVSSATRYAGSLSSYLRPAWYATIAMIVLSVAVILNAPAPHIVYKAF